MSGSNKGFLAFGDIARLAMVLAFFTMPAISVSAAGQKILPQPALKFLNANALPQLQQLQTLPFALKVRNDGKSPLHFKHFTTICDCIRVVKHPAVLSAGGEGVIELACTGHEAIGTFRNQLTACYTRGSSKLREYASTPLLMHTVALRDIKVSPRRYDFGWQPPAAVEPIQIAFTNCGTATYAVKRLHCNSHFKMRDNYSGANQLLSPGTTLHVTLQPRIFAAPGKYHFRVSLNLMDVKHPNVRQKATAGISGTIAAPPVVATRNLATICSMQGPYPEVTLGVPAVAVLRVTVPSPFRVMRIFPDHGRTIVELGLRQAVEAGDRVLGRICVFTTEGRFPIFGIPVNVIFASKVRGSVKSTARGDQIKLLGLADAKGEIRVRNAAGQSLNFTEKVNKDGIILSTSHHARLLLVTVPVPLGRQQLLVLAPPKP